METTTQEPQMTGTGRTAIAEQTYRGVTIHTQRNGYLSVVLNDQRKGGFVSLEEAQAYIINAR